MSLSATRTLLIGAFLCLIHAASAPAQTPWSWPEKPENLQVLPKDWPGSRLRAPMTGFTRALGVRCSYCHVGEEGKPLSTYDFASDENPNKERARDMLRMLGDINTHLRNMETSSEDRVNMWCHTCHRGRPRPMALDEELGMVYQEKGLAAALEHYDSLRDQFYGRGAYNFGERSLNNFGYEVLGKGDTAGAIEIFSLNTSLFPLSANLWDSLAEAHMKAGHMDLAEKYYMKTLEMQPRNPNAQQMLKQIRSAK